jgi:hypothetical protein
MQAGAHTKRNPSRHPERMTSITANLRPRIVNRSSLVPHPRFLSPRTPVPAGDRRSPLRSFAPGSAVGATGRRPIAPSSLAHLATRPLGHSATWPLLEHEHEHEHEHESGIPHPSRTWPLGHSATWPLGHLATRPLGHSATRPLGHLATRPLSSTRQTIPHRIVAAGFSACSSVVDSSGTGYPTRSASQRNRSASGWPENGL